MQLLILSEEVGTGPTLSHMCAAGAAQTRAGRLSAGHAQAAEALMVQAAVCIGDGKDCEGLDRVGVREGGCSCRFDHGLCMLCYMPVPLMVA